ncbi:MAG TPA: MMPL family transporter [Methylomirabilota bacterium]|nr:MMPL family transporter [Methylomirabilota bacterium]
MTPDTRHAALYRLGEQLIEKRTIVLVIITIVTLLFAAFALRLDMVTRFDELLPQNHPFIKVHNQYASTFGGANTISLMLEVNEGTIFTRETLTKIFEITQRLDRIHGVNHELINSIAHRTNRRVRMLSGGLQVVDPVMAHAPKTDQDVNIVRQIVHTSRNLYGVIVSLDEKATLITATFIEGRLDHRRLFDDITGSIIEPFQDANTRIYVAGEPWKYGWVYYYAKEVFVIFFGTAVLMWVLLYWYFRDVRGALRPTITGVISAIWGLGFIKMIGFSLDPLTMVIPFFVTARAVSHSVQMHDRYYEEFKKANWRKQPAIIASFAELFAPTLSGILTDALGLLVMLLVPIVLLQKLAVSAAVWILAITISELLLNPIVYYYLREPDLRVVEARERGAFKRRVYAAADFVLSPMGKAFTLAFWGVVLAGSVYYWQRLVIGDPTSAEPLLQRDSEYNIAHARIQDVFGGTEPLMIVVEKQGTSPQNSVALPEVLHAIEKLQRYLERDPSVGLSFSFVDILPVVNAAIHEMEAKWEVLPRTERQVSLLLAAYFSGNSYQDTNRFIDSKLRAAPIWFYCTDHKSENIRRIIKRAQEFIDAHPLQPARFLLAGGRIGVLAAANDELLKNDILVNVLGFATIFVVVILTYRSFAAGVYMLIPLLVANAVVNAYMGARDIGININTLPVVTVGVGFGIDYGLYLVSRIIEEFRTSETLREAVRAAVATSGKSISFTAITMILGTLLWTFSHIRFNSEMGLLLALWMGVSFLATMTLLPVLAVMLKPRFILRERAA